MLPPARTGAPQLSSQERLENIGPPAGFPLPLWQHALAWMGQQARVDSFTIRTATGTQEAIDSSNASKAAIGLRMVRRL